MAKAGKVLTLPMRASIPRDFVCDLEVSPVSRGTLEEQTLSPFLLGPCRTPNNVEFQNMENLWQFSKVYPQLGHVETEGPNKGLPNDTWSDWHLQGAADSYAHRYPAGRGQVPAYSYWGRYCLSYIVARKMVYIPEYAMLAAEVPLYKQLRREYRKGANIIIRDFDAYSIWNSDMTLLDVFNGQRRAGHGFVLAAMLVYGTRFYKTLII
jgi:hypothetical protein